MILIKDRYYNLFFRLPYEPYDMVNDEIIVVDLEVGHDTEIRRKPTRRSDADGLTHNWRVFVRGKNSKNISSFVESIDFYLCDMHLVREAFAQNLVKTPLYNYKFEQFGYWMGYTISRK